MPLGYTDRTDNNNIMNVVFNPIEGSLNVTDPQITGQTESITDAIGAQTLALISGITASTTNIYSTLMGGDDLISILTGYTCPSQTVVNNNVYINNVISESSINQNNYSYVDDYTYPQGSTIYTSSTFVFVADFGVNDLRFFAENSTGLTYLTSFFSGNLEYTSDNAYVVTTRQANYYSSFYAIQQQFSQANRIFMLSGDVQSINKIEIHIFNTDCCRVTKGIKEFFLPQNNKITYLYMANQMLSQNSVDNILVNLDYNNLIGGYCNVYGGSNATPSSVGKVAANRLKMKNWTVIIN